MGTATSKTVAHFALIVCAVILCGKKDIETSIHLALEEKHRPTETCDAIYVWERDSLYYTTPECEPPSTLTMTDIFHSTTVSLLYISHKLAKVSRGLLLYICGFARHTLRERRC